jgi:small-conductance mechanosensitive channel
MKSFLFLLVILSTQAVIASSDSTATLQESAGVVIDGDTLFTVLQPLGPFSASERAARTMKNLELLMSSRSFTADSLVLTERGMTTDVVYKGAILFSVTTADAEHLGSDRSTLAAERLNQVGGFIGRSMDSSWNTDLLMSIATSMGLLLLLIGLFWLSRIIFPKLYASMEKAEGTLIRGIRIRSYELITAASMGSFLQILTRGFRLVLSLAAVYYAVMISMRQFDVTRDIGIEPYLFGFLTSILVTTTTFGVLRVILRFHTWAATLIYGWKGSLIRPVRLKSVEVLSEARIAELLVLSTKLIRFGLIGFVVYFYVTLILGLFPLTSTWSETLFGYILTPFMNAVSAFVNYIPNLFSIIVIIVLTSYLLRLMKFISLEIARGTLTLPGFFPDWAIPTFKIARFLVIIFAAVVIFPYLPGSDSPFFQGISIFVGVLFSLGSSSAVANIVSGVVLTYMRPFQISDRVKIADTVGEIVEKTLLVTRIRTIKNVDVTIPNAMVLGAHIINYSSSAEDRGLVLHTTVTIGYDVPWRKVHELLLEAARKTEAIIDEPASYVHQTALDDFYVRYELNAPTDNPSRMAGIYSDLHQNIQDVFNEAGIEIMSPHFAALRDGNDTAMPPGGETLPPPPPQGFRIRKTE